MRKGDIDNTLAEVATKKKYPNVETFISKANYFLISVANEHVESAFIHE